MVLPVVKSCFLQLSLHTMDFPWLWPPPNHLSLPSKPDHYSTDCRTPYNYNKGLFWKETPDCILVSISGSVLCIYLVVINRPWDTLMWSCLRIYICPVFPSVGVHSFPLSLLFSVHSKYLYLIGENYFFMSFKQIPFCFFHFNCAYSSFGLIIEIIIFLISLCRK